jgi:hypothetical protein
MVDILRRSIASLDPALKFYTARLQQTTIGSPFPNKTKLGRRKYFSPNALRFRDNSEDLIKLHLMQTVVC